MKNIARNLLSYASKLEFSFAQYFITFFAVVFIRTFLENFSSPDPSGNFFSFLTFFIHYPLFYLSIFVSINILIYLLTKIDIKKIFSVSILFFPIIILPPIVDFLLTGGAGWRQAYLFQEGRELLFSFFIFFGKWYNPGITLGIRIEVFLVLVGIFIFTLSYTKNIFRSILSLLAGYVLFFIYFALPSLVTAIFSSIFLLREAFSLSLLNNFNAFSSLYSSVTVYPEQFNIFMGRILWIMLFVQFVFVARIFNKKAFNAWLGNLRWERVIHYFFAGLFGIFLALKYFPAINFIWVDIFAFIIFFASIALSFWLSVGINDIADLKCDIISNITRPLVSGGMNRKEQATLNFILFFFLLFAAALLNYIVFIVLIIYQAIAYIYSSYPLRLKRYLGISSLIISFLAVLIIFAGFYFISPIQSFNIFPLYIGVLALIALWLGANVKDIKDFKGDKKDGVNTIMTVFGEKRGKKIIAWLVAISVLIIPALLFKAILLAISLPIALFMYYLVNGKDYKEIFIFLTYFFYIFILFIFL